MVGAQLGNYRVGDMLGEGGMGVVYRGQHEVLGHAVAIKVLRSELTSDASMVKRFFNEAQAATAIRNPGIVHIYDFGTSPDGATYFVMELLDGVALSARLAQRRLDLAECCRVGRQVANVLQAAHARGITHRDLKPDNLFLVPDAEVPGGERVKVLDFGIAKLASDAQSTHLRTRTGLVLGTPRYMSPEQCSGAGVVDARADIYSLGCILFEMACGRPPFEAEGAGAVVGAHQFLEPPRPETIAPGTPPALSALILNMLAKSPAARPQTMAEVGAALEEIQHRLGERSQPVQRPDGEMAWQRQSTWQPQGVSPQQPTHGAWQPFPPSSTTLGGSARMLRSPAPAPQARRSSSTAIGIGVAIAVLGGVVIAISLRSSGSDPEPRGAVVQMPSAIDAGAIDAQTAVTADEPAPPPPPSAPAPAPPEAGAAAIAGADTSAPGTLAGAVELECHRYRYEQKWEDLDACAERLQPLKPQLARELKERASLERRAAPRIRVFEQAMGVGDLKRARAQLDAIPGAVSGRAAMVARYEAAEQAAIRELAGKLERAKAPGCRQYNSLLAVERAGKPERIVAEAAQQVPCVSGCNFEELVEAGREHFAEGRIAAALAMYEVAIACRPDQSTIQKAFIASCNLRSTAKAKALWKRMAAPTRSQAIGVCVRNGITEDDLNN